VKRFQNLLYLKNKSSCHVFFYHGQEKGERIFLIRDSVANHNDYNESGIFHATVQSKSSLQIRIDLNNLRLTLA
jgi:hypothetical protein